MSITTLLREFHLNSFNYFTKHPNRPEYILNRLKATYENHFYFAANVRPWIFITLNEELDFIEELKEICNYHDNKQCIIYVFYSTHISLGETIIKKHISNCEIINVTI